jgi:hypothetical protein
MDVDCKTWHIRSELMCLELTSFSVRSRIWVCFWAILFIQGCSRPSEETEQISALNVAEDRWKRGAPRDYSFEIHPFAPLSFGQNTGKIEVRGGIVKSVVRLGSLDPPRTTVDELFASIRKAATSGHYAKIEATYDARLGYPTRIVFTANQDIRDGNSIVKISGFEDLTGR